ncbi:MAG: TonB-dependent receptor [Flavobacteriales bacterium]|nr:TonB-dependent receptor [Flavobacteriales bacterium]
MRFAGSVLLFFFSIQLFWAQEKIKGIVTDAETGGILAGANVRIVNSYQGTITDANGRFELVAGKSSELILQISYVGYETITDTVKIPFLHEYRYSLRTASHNIATIEIAGIRASDITPVTQVTLSESDIQKENIGRDLPFILDQTPSVVVNSDAGAGVGYTGIRIRGTDPTRINVTINGIPVNDAESQGVFWVNMPDLASSVASVQIQRGVGTSTNGAGSFGATVNIQTNQLIENPFAEISSSVGMFNTFKNTAEFGTGLIGKRFAFTGRLSKITSDGFIDRAWSDLKSFFVSGGYYGKTTTVNFNVFSGAEKTYQAWYGVPEWMIDSNRTFNSAGTDFGQRTTPYENETDNYQQDHYQMFVNQQIGKYSNLNIALYYTRGRGYYEQYKVGQKLSAYGMDTLFAGTDTIIETDLVRQLWLDNHLLGGNITATWKKRKWDIVGGGGANTYFGNHFGKVVWAQFASNTQPNHEFYRYDAQKTDVNVFTKATFEIIRGLYVFADMQYRFVNYQISGFRNNPGITVNKDFHFFNPKGGLTYQINSQHALYAYFGIANKEPNRDDFEAGITQQPNHETLRDLEIGYNQRGKIYTWSINGFWMDYTNQLILTGKVNDVGAYTRINIPKSYRLGIELMGSVKPHPIITLSGNIAFSMNRIENFTEYYDNYDTGQQDSVYHGTTDIAFSPWAVGGFTFTVSPIKNLDIELTGKYVARQYLDNTSQISRSLDPFFVNDFRLRYALNFKSGLYLRFNIMVINLTNRMYAPNGYTFSYVWGGTLTTENYLYPQAGIHVMGGVTLGFSKELFSR